VRSLVDDTPGHVEPEVARELRPGTLGLARVLGHSVAVLNLGVAGAVVAAASANAGVGAPWAFAIAGIGCLCLASIFFRLTSRIASAGGVYTFIARGLGPNTGFVGGWLYAGAFAAAVAVVLAIGSATLSTLLSSRTSWHPGWFACFILLLGGVGAFALLGIRLSTSTQVALGTGCMVAILVVAAVVLGKGGDAGLTLEPFSPSALSSAHGLFVGVAFAIAAFLGFVAAAALGEEAAAPRTTITRAIVFAAVLGVAGYVFVAWVVVVGFGTDDAGWVENIAPLDALASRYGGGWLAVLVDLAVVASSFIAALACTNLTARTLLAMGREHGLPRVFAWTHPRLRTPWVGIGFTLGAALGLAVFLGRDWDAPAPSPFPFVQTLALALVVGVLVVYILVALSAMVLFRRSSRDGTQNRTFLDVVVPLAAISVCGYTLVESVEPLPPAPVGYGPWIALAWLTTGLAAVVWLNVTRPARVREFGSIFDGTDPGAPVESSPLEAARTPGAEHG
jgi:amino acid transporter